ncbi:MAG: CPBP family intramembrane metalloprotease [Phormidesmis sp. RL_2_1]|nr:CPBP family intramembrane metalloprotease [Phormidesmis sp. RL_2_1]
MPHPEPKRPEIEPLSRAQLLVAMAATALLLLVIARVWLFFDPFHLPIALIWRDAGIGMVTGLGISAISGLNYRLWPAYRQSANFYLAFVLAPLVPFDSIWVGLLPGMSEELLFRGVVLPAVGLNLTGLVVSSLCFGVLHMSSRQQWPYAAWASLIGLILGSSVLITGNLLVPVVAHITTNFVSSLFWQLRQRHSQTSA